jgi:hypothetical protein
MAMLFLMLTAACSPPENKLTANNNVAPAVDTANANTPSVTAQPATPLATATPAASPAPTAALPAPPKTNPATETAAKPAAKETAHVEGPRLVMVSQEKDLDFGKQPQDKTMVRPIRIKNGGNVALNIESVSPS